MQQVSPNNPEAAGRASAQYQEELDPRPARGNTAQGTSGASSIAPSEAAKTEAPKTPNKDAAEKRIAGSWFSYAMETVISTVKYVFNKIWSYVSALFCCNNPVSNLEEFARLGMIQYNDKDEVIKNQDGKPVTQAKEAAAKFLASPSYYMELPINAFLADGAKTKEIYATYERGFEAIAREVVNLRAGQLAEQAVEIVKTEATKNGGKALTDPEIKARKTQLEDEFKPKLEAPAATLVGGPLGILAIASSVDKNAQRAVIGGLGLLLNNQEKDVLITLANKLTDVVGLGNGAGLANAIYQGFSALIKSELPDVVQVAAEEIAASPMPQIVEEKK